MEPKVVLYLNPVSMGRPHWNIWSYSSATATVNDKSLQHVIMCNKVHAADVQLATSRSQYFDPNIRILLGRIKIQGMYNSAPICMAKKID